MALPRDRLEVAWTAAPWDTDPFWVDVTPWLLAVGRERGRQPRDTGNRATKLTARLDNRTGRFTMQNGPAATNLVPEAGQPGWVSLGGTVVLHGGWLRVTHTGSTISVGSPFVTGIVAGTTYRLRAFPRPVTTARTAKFQVQWYTAADVSISVDNTAFVAETSEPMQASLVAPATAAKCIIRVEWAGAVLGEAHDLSLMAMAATADLLPPYWPHVEPRRPCRWQTDHNGTTYDRFEGLLESLPTAWTDFGDEQATYTAAGRLAAAADVDLPGSVWETTMKALAPTNWWRLDDPETAVQFSDSGSAGQPAVIRSNPGGGSINGGQPAAGESSKFIPGRARKFDGTWTKITPGVVTGAGDWTVAVVARLDLTRPPEPATEAGLFNGRSVNLWTVLDAGNAEVMSARVSNFFGYFTAPGTPTWEAVVSAMGSAAAPIAYENSSGNPDRYRTDLIRDDWFTVTIRRSGNVIDLFLNGLREGTTPWSTSIAGAQLLLGVNALAGSQGAGAELDEAAAWSRALTDAEIVTLDSAARTPWVGDKTHARYNRFPALTGIPTARMVHGAAGADAGATLGPTHLAGKALTYLHRLARSVRGRVLDTVDGNIELRTGGDLLGMRTSLATFGQQSGDLPYEKISTDPSFERIVTVARAKNVDGAVQETVADDIVPGSTMTYVQRYGRRGPTEGEIGDLLLVDDRHADDFTAWLVSAGKRPDVALDPLVLHPLGDEAVTVQCLSLDLDDVVTVRKKHPAQSQTVTAVVRVAGINETVSINGRKRTWNYSLRLEPLDPTPYILADGASLADGTHIAY